MPFGLATFGPTSKIAGVGMGSPRLVRIIGFLGCTQYNYIDLYKVLSSVHYVNIVPQSHNTTRESRPSQ